MVTAVKENPAMVGTTRTEGTTLSARRSRLTTVVPAVLALLFAIWALRGVGANNVVDTDAARHAMNGAFIRDLVVQGKWGQPVEFGKYYYGHLPALSMPYHPPLFPAIESVFFLLFGTTVFSGRLVVALFVAISLFLFSKLVLRTHGSLPLAIAAVVTFCSWHFTQMVASDIMLEFPSLAFCLAALLVLGDPDRGLSLGRGLLFALLSCAAVWTKQHAVFIGGVPFAYIVLTRRWYLLKRIGLWAGVIVYSVGVLALISLSAQFSNTGADQMTRAEELTLGITHHIGFYWEAFTDALTAPGAVVMLLALIAAAVLLIRNPRKESGLALYAAWACCYYVIILLLDPFDFRYVFFLVPPLTLIVYDVLNRGAERLKLQPWHLSAVGAIFFGIAILRMPTYFLSGPSEAASVVVASAAKRVLYCGSADGNFIFAVRTLDPSLNTVVMPGDKFSDELKDSASLSAFVERYGVTDVVIESTSRAQTCDAIHGAPPQSLAVQKVIPLNSSLPRWNGSLTVYRVTNTPAKPRQDLNVPIPKIGRSLEVKL